MASRCLLQQHALLLPTTSPAGCLVSWTALSLCSSLPAPAPPNRLGRWRSAPSAAPTIQIWQLWPAAHCLHMRQPWPAWPAARCRRTPQLVPQPPSAWCRSLTGRRRALISSASRGGAGLASRAALAANPTAQGQAPVPCASQFSVFLPPRPTAAQRGNWPFSWLVSNERPIPRSSQPTHCCTPSPKPLFLSPDPPPSCESFCQHAFLSWPAAPAACVTEHCR